MSNLGRLEKVDLRKIWKNEASGFTPWLAIEENLILLSETIGLELELEEVERYVGNFKADIFCKDALSDSVVIIENQLEKTDHSHLGQLLTYASGLEKVTIVWIAEYFRDEHRAALDWLNSVTDEEINFFGIEIELWKIGESPIAPKFNVVCKPNDWSRLNSMKAKGTSNTIVTETKQMQLEYWEKFIEYLSENGKIKSNRKVFPQHWALFPVGKALCYLTCAINTQKMFIRVRLSLRGPYAKERFQQLYEMKEQIESEIGAKLVWEERPNNAMSLITLDKENEDPSDRNKWDKQFEWLQKYLEGFYYCFSRYLKEMD